jgi:hypothetical protein
VIGDGMNPGRKPKSASFVNGALLFSMFKSETSDCLKLRSSAYIV